MKTFKITTIDTQIERKTYFVDEETEASAKKFIMDKIEAGDNMYDLIEETDTVQSDEVFNTIIETQEDGNPL